MVDLATITAAPPGGVQPGDYVPVVRPGSAEPYQVPVPAAVTLVQLTALIAALPTSTPSQPGRLWLDGQTLAIS